MKYKEIDRDLLIRKRRIAFELGESTLPKYAKKFIERVLDSAELTPTFSEAEIRADEMARMLEPYDVESIEELIQNVRAKTIEEFAQNLKLKTHMENRLIDILAEQMKGDKE